jgi:hypothetical protein
MKGNERHSGFNYRHNQLTQAMPVSASDPAQPLSTTIAQLAVAQAGTEPS